MNEIILLAFLSHAILSVILTLKTGKDSLENASFPFKFLVVYGTMVIVAVPILSLAYFTFILLGD